MTKHAGADYVVLRAHPDLPPGFLPPELEGRWYDLQRVPFLPSDRAAGEAPPPPALGGPVASYGPPAVAVPTGRFEVRDDGAVAEVWEVCP